MNFLTLFKFLTEMRNFWPRHQNFDLAIEILTLDFWNFGIRPSKFLTSPTKFRPSTKFWPYLTKNPTLPDQISTPPLPESTQIGRYRPKCRNPPCRCRHGRYRRRAHRSSHRFRRPSHRFRRPSADFAVHPIDFVVNHADFAVHPQILPSIPSIFVASHAEFVAPSVDPLAHRTDLITLALDFFKNGQIVLCIFLFRSNFLVSDVISIPRAVSCWSLMDSAVQCATSPSI